jgi:hypothetical protein
MSVAGAQINQGEDCKAAPDAHTLRCLPWSGSGVKCATGQYVAERCEQAHEARGIFRRSIRAKEAMAGMNDDELSSDEDASVTKMAEMRAELKVLEEKYAESGDEAASSSSASRASQSARASAMRTAAQDLSDKKQ